MAGTEWVLKIVRSEERRFETFRFASKLAGLVLAIALIPTAFAQNFFRDHCLFIKNGYLKSESSTPSQLLADYDRYGNGEPIVIHFHGGLVSEDNAKKEASSLYTSCYRGVSYPIFMVWNADFFSELQELLAARYGGSGKGVLPDARIMADFVKDSARNLGSLPKPDTEALAGTYADIVSAGHGWADWENLSTWDRARRRLASHIVGYISPYIDSAENYHASGTGAWGGDLLEWISANFGGKQIWARMKRDTADSFVIRHGRPGAGLALLWALKAQRHLPRIVLVGHSAGCIYIANFIRAAKAILPGVKFDVVFLAPANTYAEAASFARDCSNSISNFRMFGLRSGAERKDHMFWELDPRLAGAYPGSLLLFVSRAVESRFNAPILGLDRDYPTPLTGAARANNLTVKRLLFNRPHAVIWSPDMGAPGLACSCSSHGEFCSDPPMLCSLRYLVQSTDW